jgi:hypothetical protein
MEVMVPIVRDTSHEGVGDINGVLMTKVPMDVLSMEGRTRLYFLPYLWAAVKLVRL